MALDCWESKGARTGGGAVIADVEPVVQPAVGQRVVAGGADGVVAVVDLALLAVDSLLAYRFRFMCGCTQYRKSYEAVRSTGRCTKC